MQDRFVFDLSLKQLTRKRISETGTGVIISKKKKKTDSAKVMPEGLKAVDSVHSMYNTYF
jgi:hypothetical protein